MKSELKMHLDKLRQCKAELKLAQENWVARNKIFNEWMQKVLKVENEQGEMHLSEILTKWDEISDGKIITDPTES